MINGELIGLSSVVLIFGVLPSAAMFFLYKVRTRSLETLIKVVELGGTVDEDMMRALGPARQGNYKLDYKYGMIWLAVGIPLFIGVSLEASLTEGIFGLIPVLIGIAFLVSAKLRLRESD